MQKIQNALKKSFGCDRCAVPIKAKKALCNHEMLQKVLHRLQT